MTPIRDAIQAVREFASRPILTVDSFPRDDSQLLQFDCFKNLLTFCRDDAALRGEALADLATVIAETPDVFQAGRVAMACGILIEWGAKPTIALPAILDQLEIALAFAEPIAPRMISGEETQVFAESFRLARAWKSLRYLIMPTMTMLSLDFSARQAARGRARLMNYTASLASHHREVQFLFRLLNLTDGDELLVLHPHENKGFRVRLEAIASNFHLFSLLQGALVGDPAAGLLTGPRPNRKVIATATGEMPHDRLITDAALWHYYNWTGLQSDGTLSATPITTWVMGEATPREIPEFEGERVVLLGPPVLASRGWDSSFFTNLHDLLRSKVEVVELLSGDEVALRMRRIRNAPRGPG